MMNTFFISKDFQSVFTDVLWRVDSLLKDIIWTSIQRLFNVMDARWTLKQRCVLTGLAPLNVVIF